MLGLFKNYIEKRISLIKLETTGSIVKAMSMVVYIFLLLMLGLVFFIFLFVGIGFILGELLGDFAYGFLAVSGFFLLCFVLFLYGRRSIVKYFKERFVQTIFTEEDNENKEY
ncbi:MAG: phage holin family protein [Flavobacteriaceae bacterium]|nr:phage holin family protein [Flavobacteriaceae bacterium]